MRNLGPDGSGCPADDTGLADNDYNDADCPVDYDKSYNGQQQQLLKASTVLSPRYGKLPPHLT